MDDYNQGKDIYMELARSYRGDLPDDELRRKYRGKCKTLVLAIIFVAYNSVNCWEVPHFRWKWDNQQVSRTIGTSTT